MGLIEIRSFLDSCSPVNGVLYVNKDTPVDEELEELYLKVRAKEGRLYNDSTVKSLPDISKDDAHYEQWQVRKNSAHKFIDYLSHSDEEKRILELGCGNGWFANMLASLDGTFVLGLDINSKELEQAARVFKKENLFFMYADIFDGKFSAVRFDAIVLNAAVQYFPDVEKLISTLLGLLEADGEIHIHDSPMYTRSNVNEKTIISEVYYESLGFPEMTKYYHHHLLSDFSKYKPELMYKPGRFSNRLRNFFLKEHNSPFPWLKIRKANQ